jgi:hypothetical protein
VTRRPAVLYALAVALIAILVAVGARRAGRDVSRARTDRTVPVLGTVARPAEGDAAVARRAAGDAAPANARKLREVTGVACYLDGAPVAEAPLMFHGMRWLGRSIVYYDSAGADVRTGADGRFSVSGVTPAPGRIALAGCLDADPDEALYDAARDETALTVRRGRVRVRVVDDAERPLVWARVRAVACGADSAGVDSHDVRGACFAERGTEIVFVAEVGGRLPAEAAFVVPHDRNESEVVLRPRRRADTAQLRVFVRDRPAATCTVRLATPRTGLPIAAFACSPGARDVFDAPPGTWRLTVTPEGPGGALPSCDVVLEEGRETVVSFDFEAGGGGASPR